MAERHKFPKKHGLWSATSVEYRCWGDMKQRCTNPRNKAFKAYGGRGISVCDSWTNDFSKFMQDMGPRPAGMSLDRIDVNGNYEPANCRWATTTTQARNTRAQTSESVGVSFCQRDQVWRAWITVHRKTHSLGSFKTEADAAAARKAAQVEHWERGTLLPAPVEKFGNDQSLRGVTKSKSGRWEAAVYVKRRRVFLGTFDTPELAAQARRAHGVGITKETT